MSESHNRLSAEVRYGTGRLFCCGVGGTPSHNRLSAEVRYGTLELCVTRPQDDASHNRLSAEVRYGTWGYIPRYERSHPVIIAFRLKSAMGPVANGTIKPFGPNVIIAFRLKSAMGLASVPSDPMGWVSRHNRLSAEVRYGTSITMAPGLKGM